MNTLRSVGELDFYADPNSLVRRVLAAVQTCWSGIRGGLEAARAYDEFIRRGVPHEVAVERIFDRHLGGR